MSGATATDLSIVTEFNGPYAHIKRKLAALISDPRVADLLPSQRQTLSDIFRDPDGLTEEEEDLYAHFYNLQGLPRISDREHFLLALKSNSPFEYIIARSSQQNFGGEDGIAAVNADDMLTLLSTKQRNGLGYHLYRDPEIKSLLDAYVPEPRLLSYLQARKAELTRDYR